ncbi:hypothetical protein EYF80_063053 [Liparis tanakae]|uniref:Uncharacterized protein n=1 Tax=Liparis tanakae TaxID=230148 RepID=A0A4Z2ED88_9TELE|nr:hypothetical protein EYF80_063053 [Liparis tanakae]
MTCCFWHQTHELLGNGLRSLHRWRRRRREKLKHKNHFITSWSELEEQWTQAENKDGYVSSSGPESIHSHQDNRWNTKRPTGPEPGLNQTSPASCGRGTHGPRCVGGTVLWVKDLFLVVWQMRRKTKMQKQL